MDPEGTGLGAQDILLNSGRQSIPMVSEGGVALHERGGLVIPVGLEDRTMISKELLLSLKS